MVVPVVVRGLKGRRIDTSMTDADGSIVQPDYVIKCWRVTNGISLVEGVEGRGTGGRRRVVAGAVGVKLEREL